MRLFIIFILLLILASLFLKNIRHDQISLDLPPASLEQWYKPANKRQQWLHTMFKLRREMQAISEYVDAGDQPRQLEWAQKLRKNYYRAADMVPEWKADMRLHQVDELLDAIKNNRPDEIKEVQEKLAGVCQKCHRKYRAITAAIYRSPDFSDIRVDDTGANKKLAYKEAMEQLSLSMNRIVINIVDQNYTAARASADELEKRMTRLGDTCHECHKNDSAKERLLGEENRARFRNLSELIRSEKREKAGRTVGEIAVAACARCHSIHRSTSAIRRVFQKK